ncbi:MAG: hypothetical protein ACSLE0_08145 [Chitinophagaceae bacterium]
MRYRIETRRWVEGYEHEFHNIETDSKEEAEKIALSGDSSNIYSSYLNEKKSEGLEILSTEEE